MKKTTSVLTFVAIAGIIGIGVFVFSGRAPSDQSPVVPSEKKETSASAEYRIVAFGDSLTAGYGVPLSEAYPALLERTLQERGFSVEVINSGVSGETSAGGVRRAEFIRSLEPDLVLFGLGGNDALRLLPPQELEKNLAQALSTLREGENPPRVLLLGMRAPGNADSLYRTAFDRVYPALASRFNLPLIPFFLEGVALDPRYTLPDGIHPSSVGYQKIVAEVMLPMVLPILEEELGQE